MKAGLLICDHVDARYQARFGDYPAMFKAFLPDLDWVFYDVFNGEFPTDIGLCEVYMTTGSRYSAYDDEAWIADLKHFVQKIAIAKKYFIGFCFGHQILAEALGGKVEKAPIGWCVGMHTFKVEQQKEWMLPFKEKLNLLMMCQDQVQELPPNAEILASSTDCPVGLFQIDKHLLGIQAHPEFSKEYDQLLTRNRVAKIGSEKVEKAMQSLQQPLDAAIFRDWVLAFIS